MKLANRINQTMPALPSHRRILVLWTIVIVFISQLFHCAFTNQPSATNPHLQAPPLQAQHSHLHVQAVHLKPRQPILSNSQIQHHHHQQHHSHQHFPQQQQQQQSFAKSVHVAQPNARQLPHLQQFASLGPQATQQQTQFKPLNANLNTHQSHQRQYQQNQASSSPPFQPHNNNQQFAISQNDALNDDHPSSMVDQLSEAGSDQQVVDNFASVSPTNVNDQHAERETYEELLSSSAGASANNNQPEDQEPLIPIGSSLSNQNQQQSDQEQEIAAGNSRVDRCRELITLLSFRDSMNPRGTGHHLDPTQLDCSKLRQQITEAVVATQKQQKPAGNNQQHQQQAAKLKQQPKLATPTTSATTTTTTSTFSPLADSDGAEISSGSAPQDGVSSGDYDSGIAAYVAPSSGGRSRQPQQQQQSQGSSRQQQHLSQLQLIRADNSTDNFPSSSSSLASPDSSANNGPSSSWQPRASAQFVNQMQQLMLQQQIAQYRQRQKLQQQQEQQQQKQQLETTTSTPMYPTESNFESMLETDTYAPAPTTTTTTTTTSTTTTTTTTTTSTTTTTTTTTPAPVSHRIKPAGGGRRVRPAAGGSQKLSGQRRAGGRAHNPSTTTTTTTAQPDYPEVNCDDPNSEDFDEVECGEIEATTTTAKPRKARRRTTTPKPTTTTTLSPGYQQRPDGRIIDYMADPNFPRELKGADLTNYPFYISVPEKINFDCKGRHDGYYADIDLHCQIYHHCAIGNRYDFLCPNYTLFDQTTFTCRFINTVDCTGSEKHFDRNNALYLEKDEAKKLEDSSSTTPRPVSTSTTPNAPIIPFKASSTTTSTTTTTTTQTPRLQITSRLGYSRPSSLSNSNNMNLALSITPPPRSNSNNNNQNSDQSSLVR